MEASELTEPTVDGALGVKAACHRSYLILDAELATGRHSASGAGCCPCALCCYCPSE